MSRGRIKKLIADRGFGFIQTTDRADIFFHSTEVKGVDFASLREGQEVEFEIGKGRDGRAQAVKVRVVETEV
jgi:CspA family cold shock protein